jgi:hypothetical protein
MFSSTAGFFGNAGQSDYAMANEVFNKYVYVLRNEFPLLKVLSVNWGPWDGGMVTPLLREEFDKRNITLIPSDVGPVILAREMAAPGADVQTVIGGGVFTSTKDKIIKRGTDFRIKRKLDLKGNPFINDHVIGGNGVLPATCAVSWIVGVCLQLNPGFRFVSCANFKVLKGIVMDNKESDEFYLDIVETDLGFGGICCDVMVWSPGKQRKKVYRYSGSVSLDKAITQAPHYMQDFPEAQDAEDARSYYEDGTLFHGPRLTGVRKILYMDQKRMALQCKLDGITLMDQGQFTVGTLNPFIMDTLFQGLAIWSRKYVDCASLPLGIGKFEYFAPIDFDTTYTVYIDIKECGDAMIKGDIVACNQAGFECYRFSEVSGAYSKNFNALFAKA